MSTSETPTLEPISIGEFDEKLTKIADSYVGLVAGIVQTMIADVETLSRRVEISNLPEHLVFASLTAFGKRVDNAQLVS